MVTYKISLVVSNSVDQRSLKEDHHNSDGNGNNIDTEYIAIAGVIM